MDVDEGSTSDSESSEEEETSSEEDARTHSAASSATSLPLSMPTLPSSDAMAESEFQNEVAQSLERAFAEGHSVENASVELKTLRMASNVSLSLVREAVVAAIVEKIKVVEGGAIPQRKEIAMVVGRWGSLIDKIGGVNAVETISCLQVSDILLPELNYL